MKRLLVTTRKVRRTSQLSNRCTPSVMFSVTHCWSTCFGCKLNCHQHLTWDFAVQTILCDVRRIAGPGVLASFKDLTEAITPIRSSKYLSHRASKQKTSLTCQNWQDVFGVGGHHLFCMGWSAIVHYLFLPLKDPLFVGGTVLYLSLDGHGKEKVRTILKNCCGPEDHGRLISGDSWARPKNSLSGLNRNGGLIWAPFFDVATPQIIFNP